MIVFPLPVWPAQALDADEKEPLVSLCQLALALPIGGQFRFSASLIINSSDFGLKGVAQSFSQRIKKNIENICYNQQKYNMDQANNLLSITKGSRHEEKDPHQPPETHRRRPEEGRRWTSR